MLLAHSISLVAVLIGSVAAQSQECPPPATQDMLLYKRSDGGGQIGTPPVGMRLRLDTKAEVTWLTTRYDPDASSTAQTVPDGTFEGYYYGRSFTGTRVRDWFYRSSATPAAEPRYFLDFGVTDIETGSVGANTDGALGLGGGPLSFFEQASYYWPERVVGIRLPTSDQTPGVMNLGYTNSSQYTGELQWINTLDNGVGWRAAFGGISTTGARTSSKGGEGVGFAIWDSAEETSAAPHPIVTAIYGNDPRINKVTVIWSMPCDLLDGTTVRISLGGKQFVLSKAALMSREPLSAPEDNRCIGNFAAGEDNNVHLGRTFMRTWYTALSGENDQRRVGLARPTFPQGATVNSISINDDTEA